MIKPKSGFFFFLLILFTSFLGWIFLHDDIFIQISVLFAFLILFSFFWTLFSISGIEILRHTRYTRQNVGEYFEETINITNNSMLWHFLLEIIDLSPKTTIKSSHAISSIGPHQTRFYNSYQFLDKRGDFQLGPMKISSGDPFGIFLSTKLSAGISHFSVLPFYEEINHHSFHFGQMSGGDSLKMPTLDSTLDASGIREYQAGDPLNRIHWISTMKRGHLIVKEFDQNPHGNVWIILDSERDIHINNGRYLIKEKKENKVISITNRRSFQLSEDTFEYAVSTAATMADFFIRGGKEVGLSHSGKLPKTIPAEKGERQLSKILDILSQVEADGEIPIYPFIESNIGMQSAGNLIVVISTSKSVGISSVIDMAAKKKLSSLIILMNFHSFNSSRQSKEPFNKIKGIKSTFLEISNGDSIKHVLERNLDK